MVAVGFVLTSSVSILSLYRMLSRIDWSLEAFTGNKYFSTLHFMSGYRQVVLDEDARVKCMAVEGTFFWFNCCACHIPTSHGMSTLWTCSFTLALLITPLTDNASDVQSHLHSAGLKVKSSKCYLFQEKWHI